MFGGFSREAEKYSNTVHVASVADVARCYTYLSAKKEEKIREELEAEEKLGSLSDSSAEETRRKALRKKYLKYGINRYILSLPLHLCVVTLLLWLW